MPPDRPVLRAALLRGYLTWTVKGPIVVPTVERNLTVETQAAVPWNCQMPATTGTVPMTVPRAGLPTTSLMTLTEFPVEMLLVPRACHLLARVSHLAGAWNWRFSAAATVTVTVAGADRWTVPLALGRFATVYWKVRVPAAPAV